MTYFLYSAVADLTFGIGVFTALAYLTGAVLIFDSWLSQEEE